MILPQIPTDNLYKFLFVAGLTLIGASTLLFINKSIVIENEINSIELEMVNGRNKFFRDSLAFVLELEQIHKSNKKHSIEASRLGDLLKNKQTLKHSELQDEISKLSQTEDKIWKAQKNSDERLASHEAHINLIKYRLEKQKKEVRRLKLIGIISIIGFLVGLWLTSYGYVKWNLNIQKPTDERIRLELEQLKSAQ